MQTAIRPEGVPSNVKGTLEGKQRTMPATFEKITNFSVYGKNPLEKETAC